MMETRHTLYRQYYEQDSIRHENVASEARTGVTIGLIPDTVKTVIDVGCGDGTLLSIVQHTRQAVGIDISFTALQRLHSGCGARASAEALPFADQGFDCVMSTEMIEHLPDDIFTRSVVEMERLARRYIVISVPYHEDLARKRMRCTECHTLYHMHYHVRAFDLAALANLFPSFTMSTYRFSGPKELFWPHWLLDLRQRIGRRWEWDPHAHCPQCGARQGQPPRRSVLSTATAIAAKCIGQRFPKWVSVLYTRK
jgi:2-polyprenyl-3-methyl-5-hydroxy-6-metoxy-1,4-benzoquinol methylase